MKRYTSFDVEAQQRVHVDPSGEIPLHVCPTYLALTKNLDEKIRGQNEPMGLKNPNALEMWRNKDERGRM